MNTQTLELEKFTDGGPRLILLGTTSSEKTGAQVNTSGWASPIAGVQTCFWNSPRHATECQRQPVLQLTNQGRPLHQQLTVMPVITLVGYRLGQLSRTVGCGQMYQICRHRGKSCMACKKLNKFSIPSKLLSQSKEQ